MKHVWSGLVVYRLSFRSVCLSLLFGGLVVGAVGGCTGEQERLFERLGSERTGVDFANTIVTDDTLMNPLSFFYLYNGGGVAAGDLNGDGRTDLFFAGNQVGNRLYLNRGNLQFRDVTETAGVAAEGRWSTGVALVDVNQDGRMDLYVCAGGAPEIVESRTNRLYVNQGLGADSIPTFEERAEEYGVADSGYSTHAAFFDYDRDGDLDLYVLNTTAATPRTGRARDPAQLRDQIQSADRLYRNDGNETFTDVSEEAGIRHEGYGLGLAISDVNKDGWPDVYVANDFSTTDRVYVNDGDGTFTNRSGQYLKHQSHSAMGVDVADVNNDARNDVMVLDMLPQDPRRRQLISNSGTRRGGELQYGRNTLQLNNGRSPEGHLAFSEIGQMAGIEATGWSWAPLLADYDNDGDRDLFVSTGYGELVTHLDFVRRLRRLRFSGPGKREALFEALDELPEVHLPNRFFENLGGPGTSADRNLQFAEQTDVWATSRSGISNGAAFADLDRDGDLDLVTNNVNHPATILENRASERGGARSLRVDLHGPADNRAGLGARVILENDGPTQYYDHSPYRGFQSTVEGIVHFGLGADSTADSLTVVWPDSTIRLYTDVSANQVLDVHYDQAARRDSVNDRASLPGSGTRTDATLFREVAAQRGLAYRHEETKVPDFRATPLLPHKFSQNGPGLAVGDVDGNGLDDVFVGADRGHKSVLFRQNESVRFEKRTLSVDPKYEDMGALFFDAEGDGDQDLYVVSGSNIKTPGSDAYQDRLYLNDGTGTFHRAEEALPNLKASGSSVTAADYDEDGDLDLFVGGRVRPRHYPLPPRSYILRNDSEEGHVQFTDVTSKVAPELGEVGLVTSALWTDFNDDDRVDLVVAGEWMPITFFKNTGDTFTDVTEEVGPPNTSGWWNSLAAGDFDRDGEIEYAAGNLGLNTRYEASPNEPVRVYAKDFDGNDQFDPVLFRYIQGTSYPAHGRREMTDQIPGLTGRFPSFREYAGTPFDQVFTPGELEGAYVAEAVRFETSYLDKQDDGTFEIRALPIRTQMAPVFGMRSGDYDGDGFLDLLMVGNWYAPDSETGRADAFVGEFLRGDGSGHFASVSYAKSGFFVDGDAKGLAEVATGKGPPLVLATQNSDRLKVFTRTRRGARSVSLRPLDRYALLRFDDGSTRKVELFYGSTYLSQSSRVLRVPSGVKEVVVYVSDGARRTIAIDESTMSESGLEARE